MAAFAFHMVTTVMDGISQRFEFLRNFFSSNPVIRIVRKFIIDIKACTIAFYKVGVAASII